MIKLWDYATCSCGKRHNDEPLLASERVPQTIKCSCGKRVGWARGKHNQIHLSNSKLYGRLDPRTGEVYEDYGQKTRDFKRRGLIEGDIEHPDDIENDIAEQQAKATERDPNVLVADSLEDIQGQVNRNQVDWANTGDPTKREGVKDGLLDSWRSW